MMLPFTNYIYVIHGFIQDLALNSLLGLICYKTQPTGQPDFIAKYFFHKISYR